MVNNEVVGFEIPDDNLFVHEVLKEDDHGGSVKLGVDGAEQADFPDGLVEGLTLDVLSKLNDEIFVLDGVVVFGDEGVVQGR